VIIRVPNLVTIYESKSVIIRVPNLVAIYESKPVIICVPNLVAIYESKPVIICVPNLVAIYESKPVIIRVPNLHYNASGTFVFEEHKFSGLLYDICRTLLFYRGGSRSQQLFHGTPPALYAVHARTACPSCLF
jgi:hypothetical protein